MSKPSKGQEVKKKWVITAPVSTEEDALLGKLSCGCTCECCIANVRSLYESRAYSAELSDALEAEKMAVADTIKVIDTIEKQQKKEVFDLKGEISKRDQKIKALEETVEVESKYRLEDKYAMEKMLEQQNVSREENETLRALIIQLQKDLEDVIKEHEADAVKIQYEEHKNKMILSKIQQYESQIYEYERNNNDLRLKLTQQFENQMAHMNSHSSNSKQSARNVHSQGKSSFSQLQQQHVRNSTGMFQPHAATFEAESPNQFSSASASSGHRGGYPTAQSIDSLGSLGRGHGNGHGYGGGGGGNGGGLARPPPAAATAPVHHTDSAAHRDSLQALLQAKKNWKYKP